MKEQPVISVGILKAKEIDFSLNGSFIDSKNNIIVSGQQQVVFKNNKLIFNNQEYTELIFTPKENSLSFTLKNVVIGINFHWERKENQSFYGSLKFIVDNGFIWAINILPVERYLESVISSEMSSSASLELLKAHAIISRSWVINQINSYNKTNVINKDINDNNKEDELIKWYDKDEHTLFDVCADDHCQRYQGITNIISQKSISAVEQTKGFVLMCDNQICDARFSKCCGGMSEEYQYCWDNNPKKYLIAVRDYNHTKLNIDLKNEQNATKWINSSPNAFCNTKDKNILSQVLKDYDQETTDFYRWSVCYSQKEINTIIEEKLGFSLGLILDFIPLERGESGRIWKLKIVGDKKTIIIGKELEIRRVLSKNHLYSSAFVVEKIYDDDSNVPSYFNFIGSGWGHGVGLCQIGAAVMGEKGYKYNEILLHYYKNAEIKNIY